jgi:DNA recombination protein RmuC
MTNTLLSVIVVSIFIILILLIFLYRKISAQGNHAQSDIRLERIESGLQRIESANREEFRLNREEINRLTKENREELNNTLKELKKELGETLKQLTEQNQQALEKLNTTTETKVSALIEKTDNNAKTAREEQSKSIKEFSEANSRLIENLTNKVEERLKTLNEQSQKDAGLQRETLVKVFKDFEENFNKNVKSFNDIQKEKFELMESKQNDLVKSTETKLDIIRATVEEKLEKTLSERLGQSFETVGKQLLEVQKGLGEMQTIAQDVGGLKKVLSNVKMRGGIGEVQLEMLLEQVLAPEQYAANVKTKAGSSDLVEFAILLPGRDDRQERVYLPIDAKFPKDAYEQLVDAYESADAASIDASNKNLEQIIKKMARDIRDKYLDPPNTTDFAIMFLPFEGIYAEVIRRSALLEQLQREFKVIVTGPTTLAAILNSLQMGFRTLALQKRSSEVWTILGAVKTEFEKFGGLLEKAQKNISTASGAIDELLGTRTNAINRKLRDIQSLPAIESSKILPEIGTGEQSEE